MLSYQPEAKESLGGQRLVSRGLINIGSRVNCALRVRAHVGDRVVEEKLTAVNRHLVLLASLDGSLGLVMPLGEKTFRRLHMLHHLLLGESL